MKADQMEAIFGAGTSVQLRFQINGVVNTKDVEVSELVGALKANASQDFGLLPPNTRWISTTGNYLMLGIELPADKWKLNTFAYTKPNVPELTINDVALPAALFIFVLSRKDVLYQVHATYLFAMSKDRIILSRDRLYHYPVPNIHNGDKNHQICYGDTKPEGMPGLAGVEGALEGFYSARFNNDLFSTSRLAEQFPWNKMTNPKNTDEYFQLLAKEKKFPQEWLRQAEGDFVNFESAVKYILKTYK